MELTTCPECDQPAEIQWRAVLESTGGPVEHAKVLCLRTHWFLLPTAMLARPPDATPGRPAQLAGPGADGGGAGPRGV
jgi:hypothetical protein